MAKPIMWNLMTLDGFIEGEIMEDRNVQSR
jgi:hypothetical protein